MSPNLIRNYASFKFASVIGPIPYTYTNVWTLLNNIIIFNSLNINIELAAKLFNQHGWGLLLGLLLKYKSQIIIINCKKQMTQGQFITSPIKLVYATKMPIW